MKLADLFAEHRVPQAPAGHHHTRPGWLQIDCPFCSPGTRRWRMGCNATYGSANCWQCGRHSLAEVVSAVCRLTPGEARRAVGGIARAPRAKQDRPAGRLVVPFAPEPLAQCPMHAAYLRRRGFAPARLERLWGLAGIRQAPGFNGRLYIPIHYNGEIVSWTTRAVGTGGIRYKAAGAEQEAMPHKHLLYGEDYCRHAVIIHEGPADVWRTGPGAVALFGTAFTRPQVARLARYPRRVVCFDSDAAAQARAHELVDALLPFAGETYNIRLDAKDAADTSEEDIQKIRELFLA